MYSIKFFIRDEWIESGFCADSILISRVKSILSFKYGYGAESLKDSRPWDEFASGFFPISRFCSSSNYSSLWMEGQYKTNL